MDKLVSVTPAQWRMLVRIARPVKISTDRYLPWTSPQIKSLFFKRIIAFGRSPTHFRLNYWVVTKFGRAVLAGKGKALWTDEEYDGRLYDA